MNNDVGPDPTEGAAPPPAVPSAPEQLIEKAPGRKPAAYVAVVLGLIGMVAGAIFFVRRVEPASGGAQTPSAAVQRMFDAIASEDALGVLETLLPGERESFRRSVQDITRELGRLEILSSDLNLGDIPGLDIEFAGLRFAEAPVAPGITTVSVVGGTATYRVDPALSPLGDFVRDLMPDESKKVVTGSDSFVGEDVALTTLREGDRWYVSFWYSIAESGRREAGAPLPPFGNGLAARGAATPEQAVEQLLRAAATLDVKRLIELMPPVEARALHDYAPLFIDEAVAAIAEFKDSFRARIGTLELSSTQSGDTALVTVDKLAFSLEIPEIGLSIDYDGECVTVQGGFFGSRGPQRQCGRGLAPAAPVPGLPTPDLGFVAVREGGQWYVSPTRTVLDGIVNTLKALKRSDLDKLRQLFGGFALESESFGFSEEFTELIPQETPSA